MISTTVPARARWAAPLLLTAAIATGCASPEGPAATTPSTSAPAPTSTAPAEVAAATPRLVLTHDQGLTVLDASTLEEVGAVSLPGFNRVNPAGDGRHVVVSTAGGFRLLDAGTWSESHGDHAHHYTAAPRLTDVTFPAKEPGHVVVHHGRTVLFDDGTGTVTAQSSARIGRGLTGARRVTTPHPHHGVAVESADRTLLVTEGTEEKRTGVRALDRTGKQIARSAACPGVHGEAAVGESTLGFGCQDGVLLYREGRFVKVDAPDPYGRVGNQAGSPESDVLLGDYKVDPDAELERPERVSLVDAKRATLRLVQLPASYSFRSLGRGPAGEALVLGTDGALHVIDPDRGTITRSVPVVGAWTEPDDWQAPRPTLRVVGGTAYVTDPAQRTLVAVDLTSGTVARSVTLSATPNEVAAAPGEAEDY